ncbi:hypothetical protein HDU97_000331 [Phlyctochytrium planicorne]|nr:hypothetical protein HDU97_000331 [Phlyctochytrium planicorne]
MSAEASKKPQGSSDAKGNSTSIVQDGRRKVHTEYPDGTEVVEEFDLKTDDILIRKWRKKTILGALSPWTFEIGEPPMSTKATVGAGGELLISESSQNPQLSRKDSKNEFIFRIRNLPYPKPTYSVTIEDRKIVVRTSNKKYFTKISITDLDRLTPPHPLEPRLLSYDHGANTLVIKYTKPPAILQKEEAERRARLQTKSEKPAKDGDVDCKTQ